MARTPQDPYPIPSSEMFTPDGPFTMDSEWKDQQVRSELERSRDAVLKAINGMRGSV